MQMYMKTVDAHSSGQQNEFPQKICFFISVATEFDYKICW